MRDEGRSRCSRCPERHASSFDVHPSLQPYLVEGLCLTCSRLELTGKTDTLLLVDLTDDEVRLLQWGLADWGGPARCTDQMAVAMAFASVDDLYRQTPRLRKGVARRRLTAADWRRVCLATAVVIASDGVGSGLDWEVTFGLSDVDSIGLLRTAQSKVNQAIFELCSWTQDKSAS